MLNFVPNSALIKEENEKKEAALKAKEEEKRAKIDVNSLAGYIRSAWDSARAAKEPIKTKLIENIRQYRGEYTTEKLTAIRQMGGSEIFLPITNIKSRALEAWIKEVLMQPNEIPWDIRPTPLPELPEDVRLSIMSKLERAYLEMVDVAVSAAQQAGQPVPTEAIRDQLSNMAQSLRHYYWKIVKDKAKEAAERVKQKIHDQFVEGGFYNALESCLHDISIFKCAFLKGPFYERDKRIKIVAGTPVIDDVVIPKYKRVSPFDIYPSADSCGINDGYLIEKCSITPKELSNLRGLEGFKDSEINAVLSKYSEGGLKEWSELFVERLEVEDKSTTALYDSDKIDMLEFWGSVRGKLLKDWGLTEIEDENAFYDICAWIIDNHVIKAMINFDPLGRKPYSKASFIEVPDSFWGISLPEVLAELQQGCNALARAIVNNSAIGSGPLVERSIDRVPKYESKTLHPWKVLDSTDAQMSGSPAYRFYQPPMISDKLLLVLQYFMKMADELSGVPAYAHGDVTVSGAGRALANYEKVITPRGLIEIGKIKRGDLVANTYGSFSTVTGVFPQGKRDIYRVVFSDGEVVDCDLEHRWSVRTHHDRHYVTLTTEELLEKGLFRKANHPKSKGFRPKWMLPKIKGIEFEEKEVLIDPYTLGLLLGDGDSRGRFTTTDPELFKYIPYKLGKVCKRGNAITRTVCGIKKHIKRYGTLGAKEKRIPKDYLMNSRNVRLELLRGLMDSDGCATTEGRTFFCSGSLSLIEDVKFLIKSLGGQTHHTIVNKGAHKEFPIGRFYDTKNTYKVYFTLPGEEVFKLTRKLERVKRIPVKHIYIVDIYPIGKCNATCITVDSSDHLFLCSNFIPTHNTASGLSMLTSNASRGIKAVIRNIDLGILEDVVKKQYYYNMITGEIPSDIPDVQIIAKGSVALIEKDLQSIRRTEFLATTTNPIDFNIIGLEGRKYLLEETAKAHGIDTDELFSENPQPNQLQISMEQISKQNPSVFNAMTGGSMPKGKTLDLSGKPISGQDIQMFPNEKGR